MSGTEHRAAGAGSAPARLGTAAARIVADGLPDEIDEWARWALLDTVAVIVGGGGTRVARAATAAAARHPGASPLLVSRSSASPEWAALVLATAGNALDYDDGHVRGGGIHAGSTVLAALLAAAPGDLPLDRLTAALVVGYEVAIRAGHLASPEVSGNDYRTSGYAAAIGAAAALAAVAAASDAPHLDAVGPLEPGLDAPTGPGDRAGLIAAAIRLATAHAPVASFVSGGARESTGWAALTAVSAVELAQSGLAPTGEESRVIVPAGPTIFDTPKARTWGGLGEQYLALGCYVKPYPCCRAAHAAIDGVLELMRSGALDPGDDSPIVVGLTSGAAALAERRPIDLGEAQFAVPFLVGITVSRGAAGLRRLGRVPLEEFVNDPEVMRAINRVRLEVDPELDAHPGHGYPARVRLAPAPRASGTRGAEAHSVTVRDALGSPERPLERTARIGKARDLLESALGVDGASAIIAAITRPRSTISLARLRQLLTADSPV